MRKLFALVATMAMVLSMFAGIAFAAEDVVGEVKLDNDMVYYTGKAADDLVVNGKIYNADGALLTSAFIVRVLTQDETPVELSATIARNGSFSVTIPGDTEVGTYDVVATATGYAIAADELNVTYKLASTDNFGFTWGETGNFVYGGTLTGVSGGEVYIVDADDNQVGLEAQVNARGQFYFFIDKADFVQPGALEMYYYDGAADLLIAKGTVAAGTAPFAVSPSTVLYSVGQDVNFKVTTTNLKVTDATYNYYIVKTGTALKDVETKNLYKFTDKTANYTELDFTADKVNLGSHKVVALVKVGGELAYTAETSFTIGRPDSVNLIGLKDSMSVETTYELDGVKVIKIDRYGDVYDATKYDIVATGAGVDVKETGIASLDDVELDAAQGGVINVTITAYLGSTKLGTFNRTITVKGGVATMTPTTMEVGQTGTLTISVKDENGAAVNNAFIEFVNGAGATVKTIDSRFVGPVNGTYTLEVKEDTFVMGTYTVDVYRYILDSSVEGGWRLQQIAQAPNLEITGKSVYTVSTNLTDSLLAGQDATVTVSVKNATGYVYPTELEIKNAKGESIEVITPAALALDKADTNNDGVKDSYKVPVSALTKAGTYTLIAKTDSGAKIGSTTFTVVKPVLSIDVTKVTNRVNSTFVFSVIDPRDNSVLDWDVEISGGEFVYIDEAFEFEYEMATEGNSVYPLLADEPYQVTVLVDADYEDAEDAEAVAELTFTVSADADVVLDTTLKVEEPSFTANPANIIAGTTNVVTLSLVDANGAALEGYEVFRGATKLGKTNADGQIEYTIAQVGIDPVTFHVELDYTWVEYANEEDEVGTTYVGIKEATVNPVYDNVKPVIGDAPATTDKDSVELTITDNVRVATIYVNGVAKPFVPGAEAKITLALVKGDNVFHVIAIDANGNGVEKVFTVNYTPAVKSVVLQGTQVERKGANLFVQIRQFEELGAVLKWDAATKTATFTVGETVVKVTVGSTTATVNGVAKTMPAAPFLSNGRTMAPTRFISEALGWKVDWAAGDIVTITLP